MLALLAKSEFLEAILDWLSPLVLAVYYYPIAFPCFAINAICLPTLVGLGVFARRRNRPRLERFATVGSLICLAIVLGFMFAFAN